MGAGNYYFSAPAGGDWSNMVYIDLSPLFWSDELERRNAEFEEYLKNDAEAAGILRTADCENAREAAIKHLREEWLDEHYPGISTEEEFYEDLSEFQHESIYAALDAVFPGRISRPDRDSAEIGDAKIIAEVGRMVIARAYTYYGDRMALIVTPREDIQDVIWSIEHGTFAFESGWPKSTVSWLNVERLREMRAENARLAGIKRSVDSGALAREMDAVFKKMLKALQENGMADEMSFRGCAWTSFGYKKSDWYQKVNARKGRGEEIRATA